MCSGTSLWRKSTAFAGSSPQARKSSATPREYSRSFAGSKHRGQRVVVRDEVERLALLLPFDGRPHHAKVVADMRFAGRLDAGKNAFHACFGRAPSATRRRGVKERALAETSLASTKRNEEIGECPAGGSQAPDERS